MPKMLFREENAIKDCDVRLRSTQQLFYLASFRLLDKTRFRPKIV